MTSPALVFDLDGTLVNTAPDLIGALNAVLVSKGRPKVKIEDARHLVGHGAQAMLDRAMQMTGEAAPPESLPGLVDDFVAHYRTHIAAESRPFPGVEATLEKLQAEGARMGVLSNKPQELTDLLIPALGFTRFFRAIHGAGKLEVVKPNARVFHHVIEEMGGEGTGAIMIGDSATDVKTAHAVGCPSIVMTYGYSPEPVETLGADRVTDDFRKIPGLVQELLGTTHS